MTVRGPLLLVGLFAEGGELKPDFAHDEVRFVRCVGASLWTWD